MYTIILSVFLSFLYPSIQKVPSFIYSVCLKRVFILRSIRKVSGDERIVTDTSKSAFISRSIQKVCSKVRVVTYAIHIVSFLNLLLFRHFKKCLHFEKYAKSIQWNTNSYLRDTHTFIHLCSWSFETLTSPLSNE